MAGARKQYELLFQLKATYGNNFTQTFSNASKAMKDMQGSIGKINSLQKDVSGYKKQQEALEKNRTKVQALEEEHDRLQREMSETEQPTEKMRKALERNEKQLEQARKAVDSEERSLSRLREELRAAGVNTDNLEASTDKLQRRYEKLQQSQERIGDLSNRIEKNNAAISKTKTQLFGVVGAAAAVGTAFYAGPITKAAEFQHQMSKVKAISGATAEELSELSSKAKQMGATTEFTAAQAGEAMEYMAMAGWKTSDMLNGIEGIMYLASASGEDLATTSDIVTDALTAFGLTAQDATHFSDVLAQASSNANTNVGMMGETFKYVAPVAGALGYSIEDTSIAIGLMANSGIKASQAGTSLRKIFLGLQGGVELTGKKLGKYHLEVENSDGSMRDLNAVMLDLREAFSQMTEAEKAANAEAIAGKTGMSGLLAIVNATDKDYKELADSIENCDGAAKKMSDTMLDNFEGKMTLAKSALDALQVSLGEALLPTFTAAVTKITEVVSKVAEFAEKNPELVRTIAKVTAGLFALKAGGLIVKLGFQEIHGGVLAVQKVLEIFKARTLIAGTNAMGLGAKLARMGSGVVGYFGNLGGAFSNVLGSSRILSKVTGVAKLIGGKLSGGVLGVFGKITGKVTGIFGKIGSAVLAGPLGKIGGIFGGIVGKIGTALAPVGNLFKVAFSPLAKLGGSLFGSFGGILGKIFPIVGAITAVITVIQLVRKNLDKIRDFVGKIFGEKGLEVFDKIVALISSVGETIRNVFSDGNIGAARDKIQEIFGDKGVAVFDKFVSVFKTVQSVVGQFISFVTQHIVPVAEQIFSVIVTTVIPGIMNAVQAAAPTIMSIVSTIATFIGQAAGVIGEFIAGLMPVISEIISFLQANVFPVVGAIFDLIVGTVLPAIANGIQSAAGIVMNILNTLLPFIQTAVTTIWSVVQPILQAALSFIQFMMPTIQSIVSNVINTISGIINGLMTVLQGIIQFITGVFTGNWSQAWEGVKNIFSGAFEGLKSIAKGVMNGIISIINAGIRGLNKIKIPDWVPGVGGKGINIPEIPQFAKGTNRTPDTFVAGENGPELITGAANRKVFTAMQTQNIFNNVARRQGVTDSDTPTAQGLKIGGGMIQITINNSPQIQAAGGDTKEIESLLRQANEEFLAKVKGLVKQALAEAREQEARVNYA